MKYYDSVYVFIFITVIPYFWIWPIILLIPEYNLIWILLSIAWGLKMAYSAPSNALIIFLINAFAWPSCFIIWTFCKLILKRDTLFENKNH